MPARHNAPQTMRHMATPAANPPSGAVLLYFKSDNKLYRKDASGAETEVAPAGAAPANMATTDTDQTVTGSKDFTGAYLRRNGNALVDTTDARLSDARTPTTHTHNATTDLTGVLPNANVPVRIRFSTNSNRLSDPNLATDSGWAYITGTTNAPAAGLSGYFVRTIADTVGSNFYVQLASETASTGRSWTRAYTGSAWTAWTLVVRDDDARLTNARTPTAHTHPVADLTATGTRSSSTFLRGDGTWAAPVSSGVSPDAGTPVEQDDILVADLSGGGTAWLAVQPSEASILTAYTDQTMTAAGVKRFPPGTLLMQNAAGTATAEPYSDVNPPGSFEMTQAAAPAANPPAGEAVLWTPDGVSLLMKSPGGVTTTIGPSAGGGGGGSGAELAATSDYVDTMPAPPATGVKLFARYRARRLVSFVGPSGVDSALQPAMFSNRIMRASAQWANATMIYDAGMPAFTAYGSAAAVVTPSMTTTNLFDSMIRVRYASATTANASGGVRIPTAMWHMSDTANKGGFFIVFRAGFNAMTAGGRAFIGMSATNAALSMLADPVALVNQFGFFMNATDTTWRFMHNDATGVATIPAGQPGANFPGKTNATDFYEFRIFCPSGNGTVGSGRRVGWSITNLRTGAAYNGAEVTTDLPAVQTALTFHAVQTNVTAAATSLDVQSFYSETDN